jgi:AcrR family transcriptional regulator
VERTDLSRRILREASDLFRRQGYAATSIKQIATAAGCTTAALYYYYEDGKSHILREVILSYGKPADILDPIKGASSLREMLQRLTAVLSRSVPVITDQMSWLMVHFPSLPDEEKRVLQERMLSIQSAIRDEIGRFVGENARADRLAWLIYSSFFGFQQLCLKMELAESADLSLEEFGGLLSEIISGGVDEDEA